ncbi:MAG: site-specific integrase [Deinococcota bacterium]
MSTANALTKSTTQQLDRARLWTGLADDILKRDAAKAANSKDAVELWGLLEAYLATYGESGAKVSANTVRSYRRGLDAWLEFANERGINLLRPDRDTGAEYTRWLETKLSPSSVRVRLASVKLLYKALRWSGASDAAPFGDVKPAKDKTAAWDKREPYSHAEVETLLEHAGSVDGALILLCGHAGLRVSEAVALEWQDIDGSTLMVRSGKGGKSRRVNLSQALSEVLQDVPRVDTRLLPFTDTRARERIRNLCERAEVAYKGIHALRHYAGTRLYAETNGLEHVARHLGHSSIETTRVYAKWSDSTLKDTLANW